MVTIEHKVTDLPTTALDTTVLEELRDTFGPQSDSVTRLYANFLTHATGYLNALRDQACDERINTLHTLKGSAALMGAVRLAALAANFHEAFARDPGRLPASAIRQLEDELAMFRHALSLRLASSIRD